MSQEEVDKFPCGFQLCLEMQTVLLLLEVCLFLPVVKSHTITHTHTHTHTHRACGQARKIIQPVHSPRLHVIVHPWSTLALPYASKKSEKYTCNSYSSIVAMRNAQPYIAPIYSVQACKHEATCTKLVVYQYMYLCYLSLLSKP